MKFIIVIILFILGLLVVLTGCGRGVTGNVVELSNEKPDCKEVQVHYTEQEQYLKTEYYIETIPYTAQECENKKLSYRSSDDRLQRGVVCIESHEECIKRHTTFFGNEKCDEYKTVCDKYKETVSFEITNVDSEKGTWIFNWMRNCKTNQPLCLIKESTEYSKQYPTIDPTETKEFQTSITYDAKGEEYLSVKFEKIPTKKVCRDVLKTKEVRRERQVTAFKPVTKYRTVTKCN